MKVERKYGNHFIVIFILLLLIGKSKSELEESSFSTETKHLSLLFNDLIDESLKWVQTKYLCSFDPLSVPPVTQDDLNVSYSITISDITIQGLSNVQRFSDVNVKMYEPKSIIKTHEDVIAYVLSSIFGIEDLHMQFRVEVLKILSLNVLDFIANGTLNTMKIPLQISLSPTSKMARFDNISILGLDDLEIDIVYQNFVGGWIPYLDTYVKSKMKESIKATLESKIDEGRAYLNTFLAAYTSTGSTNQKCATPPTSIRVATLNNVTTTLRPYYEISLANPVRGLPKATELVIMYNKSILIGHIPPPGDRTKNEEGIRENITLFYGFFDEDRKEFVINHNGHVYKRVNSSTNPTWPLIGLRENHTFCLYAQDESSGMKIKLNPFITKNYGGD